MGKLPEGLDPNEVVLFEIPRVLCPHHGELFRPHWQTHHPDRQAKIMKAMIEFWQKLSARNDKKSFWYAAREIAGGETPGVAEMNKVTQRRPFCYFATREELRNLLTAPGVLGLGRCYYCGRGSIGGPYQHTSPVSLAPMEKWVCMECVLDQGERFHRDNPQGLSPNRADISSLDK